MAADPRRGPSDPTGERRLSVPEARFYAAVFGSARKGSLAELRRLECSEEEAEEIFTAAFERVMETVDPIARGFSEAQMVSYVKRACWTHLVAERQHHGALIQIELESVSSLDDPSSPTPEEIAEAREMAAIGREALQMLPDRDRLIFRQRHQMSLSPEEIVHNTPGLSPRTYRKIIQRANTRALDAFERIRGGERCEEMRAGLLRRYVAEQSPEAERRTIEAHLAHCRACQREQARMRGFLSDVAGALLAAVALAEPSRGVRERVRDALLRLAAQMPGQGGETAAGQALNASTLKVASACVGFAGGVCLATGIVPGVGGIGRLVQPGHADKPPTRSASQRLGPARRATLIDTLPTPDVGASNTKRTHSHRGQTHEQSRSAAQPSTAPAQPTPRASYSASEARVSGRQVGTEMGAESAGQPLPQPAAPPPAPPSSESGPERSQRNRPPNGSTTSSEFGM